MNIGVLLDEVYVAPEAWATGLDDLDRVIGGAAPGQVWVITSEPGEGRSTLLLQLVHELAVRHRMSVELAATRTPAEHIRARLLALSGAGVLTYPQAGVAPLPRSVLDLDALRSADLEVYTGGAISVPRIQKDTTASVDVWAVDDVDAVDERLLPEFVRLAAAGAFCVATASAESVLQTQPRRHLVRQQWAAVADLVIEVSSSVDGRWRSPGSYTLVVRRNRFGPTPALDVALDPARGRFRTVVGV